MATTAAGSPPAITTVAESARACSESFQKCLNKAAQIHHRELSLVEDQHARFAIWAANIRVFSAGRDSLDHRLREASDVQDAVIGLLQALDYRIQSCSNVLEPIAEETSGKLLEKVPEDLDQAIEGISKELTLLHKISNTIRRASKEKQNVQAEKSFKIQDEEGNDAELFLRQLFRNQIRDRFPGASENIQQRLANSMVLRRKRILYRRKRYEKKPIRPPELPLPPTVSAPNVKPNVGVQRRPMKQQPATAPTPSIVPSVPQTATTLVAEKFQQAAAPSVISVSKTVALSSHGQLQFPPAPCGALMKRYRRFKKEQDEQLNAVLEGIPGYCGPKAAPAPGAREAVRKHRASHKQTLDNYWDDCLRAVGEVVCQFCFYALPVRDAVQESKWRLHVKNDLDPYVCLFEECDSSEHLYNHSDAWLKHMKQHAMRWRCTSKSHPALVCDTREEYINHMETSHGGKFNEAQLGVLADRSGRATGPLFPSCPLCGVQEVKGGMEEHVVGHMRFLALKSLPAIQEEELGSEPGSDDSAAASGPQSRSTIDNDRQRYTPFDPDDLFNLLNSNRQHDESIDFVDEAVFADVPDDEWRLFEWGFIPSSHGTALDYNSDPIVLAFLFSATGMKSTGEFDSSGRPTFWADPDCAICHAPASIQCDCEAKAVDIAVKQQEDRILEPIWKRARDWARKKAQNFITNEFKTYVESQDFKTYVESGGSASEGQDAALALSRQETNEAWAANVLRYPETIEYFFGLAEVTLPAEDEPAVRDPKPRPPHSIFPRPRQPSTFRRRRKGRAGVKGTSRALESETSLSPDSRESSPGGRRSPSSRVKDLDDSISTSPGKKPTDQPTGPTHIQQHTLPEGDEPTAKDPPPRSNSRPRVLASHVEDDSVDIGSEESYMDEFDDDGDDDDDGKTNKYEEYDEEMKVPPPGASNSSAPGERKPGEGSRPSPPLKPRRHVSYVEDADEESDVSDSILANTGSMRASSRQALHNPNPYISSSSSGAPGGPVAPTLPVGLKSSSPASSTPGGLQHHPSQHPSHQQHQHQAPPPVSPLHPPAGYYSPPDVHHGRDSKPASRGFYDPTTDTTKERRVSTSDAAMPAAYWYNANANANTPPASTPKARDSSVPGTTYGGKPGQYGMEDIRYKMYPPKHVQSKHYTVEDVQYPTYNIDSEETKRQPPHDSTSDRPNNDELPRPSSDRRDENQEKTEEKTNK